MTSSSGRDNETELRDKAQKISQLQVLIGEYPAEAQLIMAAIEDGVTFGPAQVMDAAAAGDAGDARSASRGGEGPGGGLVLTGNRPGRPARPAEGSD